MTRHRRMADYATIEIASVFRCSLSSGMFLSEQSWLKPLAPIAPVFGNLLAQTIIVGRGININATNSEEIQKMELMTSAIIEVPVSKDKTTALIFVI